MVTITVVGADRVADKLHRISRLSRARVERGVERSVRLLERHLKSEALTGSKGSHPLMGRTGAAPPRLGVRSGHTRRSVTGRTFRIGQTVVGVVGSPERHLVAHERGMRITGKRGLLRIPTRFAQTGAGVDRNLGRRLGRTPGTAIFKSRAGNLFIWDTTGRSPKPLYLLKPAVTLRRRGTWAWSARQVLPEIRRILAGQWRALVEGR